jgi:hypothetical protein
MGSTGTRQPRHRGTWSRWWRRLLGQILTCVAVCSGALAYAQPAPSGAPRVPAGYRHERDGATSWTYPKAAETEVRELQRQQRVLWPNLGTELGVYLEPELDLRVAVNPEQMQALAPPGRTLPSYASGVAFPAEGIVLLTLTAPESWVRPDMARLLAHELSHVALHRALHGRPVPRWFAEGLAVQQSGEHSFARLRTLWLATLQGNLMPLGELAARFPARHGEVDIAYAQSADLVGFMLQGEAAASRFRALCRALQNGDTFDAAFAAAYRLPLSDFERQWRLQLTQRLGHWPSILSGLTVVWALAALLLVFGYVQVRRRHRNTLRRWAIEEAPMSAAEPQATASQPPPLPAPRSVADLVLDAWGDQQRHEAGIPTIVHEGRSYTLH